MTVSSPLSPIRAPFVRTNSFFGPDRRRTASVGYVGPERRKTAAELIRNRAIADKSRR